MVDADIYYIDQGRVRHDHNQSLQGAVRATESDPNPDFVRAEVPVYSLLIDHPEGLILWDTGSHPEAANGHWPEKLYDIATHEDAHEHAIDKELEKLGFSIADVDYVVMSHLHMDHAGDLRFFDGSETPIFVHREELKNAYYQSALAGGSGGSLGSLGYVREDFDHDLNWNVIQRKRETHFEGIEFIHLGGHTPGLIGAILHLDDPGTIFVLSDYANFAESYEQATPLGGELIFDKKGWWDNYWWLKDLERKHEPKIILYGHEPRQLKYKDIWR